MERVPRTEVPVVIDNDGVELRMRDEGAMTVCFVRLQARANVAPALRGLPGDRCPCPHWGYMLRGWVRVQIAEGPRDDPVGEAFYWGPGHAPEALEDSEYVRRLLADRGLPPRDRSHSAKRGLGLTRAFPGTGQGVGSA
jgi:hypothetical protein